MRRDGMTLSLFADELLPASLQFNAPELPPHWPPAKRENFTWWCQNGNNEMCAAVLWKSEGFERTDAAELVRALRSSAPVVLMRDSPPCAHFALPMDIQGADA
jgi:hypothetical protein